MTKHEELSDDLIAMALGDRRPSPALERWLATRAGQRELAAHRRVLETLDALHGAVPATGPTAYVSDLATPIGRLLVAATDAGLVRVVFRQSEAAFTRALRDLGLTVTRSTARTDDVVRQLRAYFAGRRRHFDVRIDLRGVTPFQRRVLEATSAVPPGQVVSYGEIARRIGRPHGGRAVGQALGRNPIPIVIPCHRVVAAGGRLGGYTGGLAIKRKLLRLEGTMAAAG
jgi:methylated-DNA-[protein]-cysteine S-methyltransferase